jgi:hypothetical protein
MSDLLGMLDSCFFGPTEEAFSAASALNAAKTSSKGDIVCASMEQSGILMGLDHEEETHEERGSNMKSWDRETDELLESILTGGGGNTDEDRLGCLGLGQELEQPFSDTSSDSGCNLEQQMQSPARSQHSSVDLIEYIANDSDDDMQPLQVVNPVTNSPNDEEDSDSSSSSEDTLTTTITIPSQDDEPLGLGHTVIETGTATIVLPAMCANSRLMKKHFMPSPPSKRRRVSQSSSDSGVDDSPKPSADGKYPPLALNEEEKRLCEREGIKLPSHYPLSREEEKNLKRIRRKIRNKVSAQDSRKRKKEYVDAMEDRVRRCSAENDELHAKIDLLETQNKTLAGQLRRLHQIIVNGGMKQPHTSTAMMVLLLSTALFLIPGFKDSSSQDSKCELDISQAIKMPPMPGQSRSLLQFNPMTQIKREFSAADNAVVSNLDNIKQEENSAADGLNAAIVGNDDMASAAKRVKFDHDYFGYSRPVTGGMVGLGGAGAKRAKISILAPSSSSGMAIKEELGGESYIEEDAPAQGYGPGKVHEERRVNVTTGQMGATRTVLLHVPKDIK